MTTFTLNNGHTFMKKDNGYCYAIVNNTKTRIALPVFNANYEQFVKEENERQNAVNIEALVEEAEESANTEAGEEIASEMLGEEIDMEKELEVEARMLEEHVGKKAPKAKKARKSKDIAYEGHGVTLTAKQVDFIHHLPDTMFWEHGLESEIWVDCLCDDIQGQFQNKPMTVGAMISTLCEKGLGTRATSRRDGRKCTSFCLTDMGRMVAGELGLH